MLILKHASICNLLPIPEHMSAQAATTIIEEASPVSPAKTQVCPCLYAHLTIDTLLRMHVHLSMHMRIHMSARTSMHTSLYLFIDMSMHMPIRIPVHMSMRRSQKAGLRQ